MKEKSLFYRLTLGLLIGVMIMPPQPARAQWAVFDGTNYASNVRKRIEDAQRHIEIFNNAVNQYTTLRGVLGEVEDLVSKQRNAIVTMANIGRTVRASMQLKDQIQAISRTRLTMLKSIDDRLRRGILDPEADLRDLENYLKTSIGRKSQDSLANLERLRKIDGALDRMMGEWEKLRDLQTVDEKKVKELKYQRELALLRPGAESEVISPTFLMNAIEDCNKTMEDRAKQMEELWTRIENRVRKYHALMDERITFAAQVSSSNKAWSDFNDELGKIQKALNGF